MNKPPSPVDGSGIAAFAADDGGLSLLQPIAEIADIWHDMVRGDQQAGIGRDGIEGIHRGIIFHPSDKKHISSLSDA